MICIRYPAHWTHQKLKFVASLRSGESITSDDISAAGEYPVYGGNGVRGYTSSYTHEGTYPVIGRQGALCGNVNYATGRFWASEHAVVVNVHDGHVVRWLGEVLRSMNLNQYSQSAAQPGISVEVIENLTVPVPPKPEQEVIANYLDRETARIDGLIAEKERMLALLDEKRAALISRVVTRGLDPNAPLKPSNASWFDKTPTHWSVKKLKWLIKSVSSGVSVNAGDQPVEGDGFGVLKTSAVAGGVFFSGENKSVWDTEYARLACPVTKNTIIMSRMNTPSLVGESGYVAEDYPNLFLPDRLWKISFDSSRVFVPFMSLLLASKEARHALSAMATGTSPSMKNLAIEEMSSLLVPVPTLEEQKFIYDEVASRDATIGPLKNELAISLLLLKERRSALITAAVTGQIPLETMAV